MEHLLSIGQFIEATGLSKSTVFEMIRRGAAPRTFKLGRRRVIAASDYAEWVAKHRAAQGTASVTAAPVSQPAPHEAVAA